MASKAKLQVCLVEGKIRNVSDFAHMSPKNRPSVFCPDCESPLILKLGTSGKMIHHAAHKSSDSECSLASGEGILHFHTKNYVFEQLKKGSQLFIKQICSGWMMHDHKIECTPKNFRSFLWTENWDDVQMERRAGNLRPDITLYTNGKTTAAIEIRVHHAVDEAKEIAFREMNLPWVEIKAEGESFDEYFVDWADGFEEEDCPWKIDNPIHVEKYHPEPAPWTCEYCLEGPERRARQQALYDEHLARENDKEIREKLNRLSEEKNQAEIQRRYSDKNDNKILYGRAIITESRFGEKEYHELFVVERSSSEPPYKPEELYVKLGRYGGEILIREDPITKEAKDSIKDYCRKWIEYKTGAKVKTFKTDWLKENEFDKIIDEFKNKYL